MATPLNIRHYDPTSRKRKKRKGEQQRSKVKLSRQEASAPAVIEPTHATSMASSGDIDVPSQGGTARNHAGLRTPNPRVALSRAANVAPTAMTGEADLSTEHLQEDTRDTLMVGDLLSPYIETDDAALPLWSESNSWRDTAPAENAEAYTWPFPHEQYYGTPPDFGRTQPGPQDVAGVINIGMPAPWLSVPESDNIAVAANNSSPNTEASTRRSNSIPTPFTENGATTNDIYPLAAFTGIRVSQCQSCETLLAALRVALIGPAPIRTGGLSDIRQMSNQVTSPKGKYVEEEQPAAARSKGVRENFGCDSPDEIRADGDRNMPSKPPQSHIQVQLRQKNSTGIDSKREISRSNNLGRTTRPSSQCRQLSPLSERRVRAWEREGNTQASVSSHINIIESKVSQAQAQNIARTSSRGQRRKRVRRCGVCGMIGHNSRTCPDDAEISSTD